MANQVYANGQEVACKSGAGQTVNIATDVCLSPPTPPAGPVPIPYPTTGMASDTAEGSKTVQITGKEVMLKNQSNFKKCTGDEAATKSLGMGVITHQITGKVYFCAWSMTVKFEDQDAVRNFDLMTHNHMSIPGDTPTWPYIDEVDFPTGGACDVDKKKEETECAKYEPHTPGGGSPCPEMKMPRLSIKWAENLSDHEKQVLGNNLDMESFSQLDTGSQGKKNFEALKEKFKKSEHYQRYNEKANAEYRKYADAVANDPCLRARRCILQPYTPTKKQEGGCCPDQTAHHLVEASAFYDSGRGGAGSRISNVKHSDYRQGKAPCVCAEGPQQTIATHGLLHTVQSTFSAADKNPRSEKLSYKDAEDNGADAMEAVFPESDCQPGCIKAQLNNYHEKVVGVKPDDRVHSIETGKKKDADFQAALDAGAAKQQAMRPNKPYAMDSLRTSVSRLTGGAPIPTP